ncbi:MAG: helix-turn-helix transcriptional regulator [Acidobacteria bacterium]|nr:helix-turn-helix transcriptional regulator [Acidobacteriota bacterium]
MDCQPQQILYTMSFGKTLQTIRRRKGKTQREVANLISMDYSYYSKLENDRLDSKPTRETIDKISVALQCNDEEKNELLLSAGRTTDEFEKVAKVVSQDPEKSGSFNRLFKAALDLTPDKLEEMVKGVEEEVRRIKAGE